MDRLQVTVAEDQRLQLQRQITEIALKDLPILPLYWNVESITMRRGVSGPAPRTGRYNQYPLTTWNVYEWDVNR